MTGLLEVRNVTKVFGGLTALDQVSFDLKRSQILGLVGPNGSGKSTMLNVLSGVYTPEQGSVALNGRPIVGLAPSKIAAAGMARTFQNLQIFRGLSVLENVLVGYDCRMTASLFGSVLGSAVSRLEERRAREEARALLSTVGLEGREDDTPASLSYGQRRLLEVARALATSPSILMLDEPCAGLSQGEADALADFIRTLTESGIGVIVIEHNMRFVLGLADHIVTLNFGRKIAEGTPASIRENEDVIAAYLGRRRHAEG